ncbi:hypothetical protein BLNAU_8758 [Blattamonas nauphoetae]|uniref:Transmembrane protein n=1 Tax=Blattamonas nauphoetae TaxID=2049346 RepID=A0ABQ9XXL1_9EUKA|nr:hypothetical protein BLNAU_8758 [Blattamonas nauphoetae]
MTNQGSSDGPPLYRPSNPLSIIARPSCTLPLITFAMALCFICISIILFVFDIQTVPYFLAFMSVPVLFCAILFTRQVVHVEFNLNSDHNRFYVKKTPICLARFFCRKPKYMDGRVSDIHDILGMFGEYRSVEPGGRFDEQGNYVPREPDDKKAKKVSLMVQLRNGLMIDTSGRFKTSEAAEAAAYVETFKKWRRNFLVARADQVVVSEYEINADAYRPVGSEDGDSPAPLPTASPMNRDPTPSPRFAHQYNTWQYYTGNKNDTDLHYVPAPPLTLPSAPVDERIVRVN